MRSDPLVRHGPGLDLGRSVVGLPLGETLRHLGELVVVEPRADLAEALEPVALRVVDREQERAVPARTTAASLEPSHHDAVDGVGKSGSILSLVLDPPEPPRAGPVGASLGERLRDDPFASCGDGLFEELLGIGLLRDDLLDGEPT